MLRRLEYLFLAIVSTTSLGCALETEVCVPQEHSIEDFAASDEPGPLVLRCDRFPSLCNLEVTSIIQEPDFERAYDIVFVGDGYTVSELAKYHRDVERLIGGMQQDPGSIIAMDPALFNFHVVDVVSESDSVNDSGTADTALGGCFEPNTFNKDSEWGIRADREQVRLAGANAPDNDVVVTILDIEQGRANSGIVLSRADTHSTLTHELGHALFGLADEYTEVDACYAVDAPAFSTLDPLALVPNLTLDPEAPKWQGLVEGAREGGRGYGSCVYHPTSHCRMLNTEHERFCPVCANHIQNELVLKRDPDFDDGPPTCGIELDQNPEHVSEELWYTNRIHDGNGVAGYTWALDGEVISTGECTIPRCGRRSGGGSTIDTSLLELGPHELSLVCCDHNQDCSQESVVFHVP